MKIKKYETNFKDHLYLAPKNIGEFFEDINGLETELINLYPTFSYQEFHGFGGAFTESAGYSLSKLPKGKQEHAISEYFSSDGLNYSFCRTHLNSCDFSLGNYAYLENDTMSNFSINRDKQYLIPMIKNAFTYNPNIKLLASPWSPPKFMKTNHTMNHGGKLKEEYKQMWADYIVEYIKAYQKEGIQITYLSVQNEPKASQIWESCLYDAKEEAEFVTLYLHPAFEKNYIHTKILIWDHNKERVLERAQEVLTKQNARNYVSGIAFHWYSGDHFESLQMVKELYPEKLLIHTEGCVGYSRFKKKEEVKNAEIYAHSIIGDMNHGVNAFIDWNMILDYHGRTKS